MTQEFNIGYHGTTSLQKMIQCGELRCPYLQYLHSQGFEQGIAEYAALVSKLSKLVRNDPKLLGGLSPDLPNEVLADHLAETSFDYSKYLELQRNLHIYFGDNRVGKGYIERKSAAQLLDPGVLELNVPRDKIRKS